MKLSWILCLLITISSTLYAKPISVLILDGQNNHDWRTTTEAVKATLQATGLFQVDVSTAPYKLGFTGPTKPKQEDPHYLKAKNAWDKFNKSAKYSDGVNWPPNFKKYQAIICNYRGASWSEKMQGEFVEYIKEGGGVFFIHAANNGFASWDEFNRIIGLGYNGTRGGVSVCTKVNDKTGDVYQCCDGKKSGHGSRHPYINKIRNEEHPIVKGMPIEWMHGRDELYHNQRGPGENMTILTSSYSDPKTRGTGDHEPTTWIVDYGKGRSVVTTMGHFWNGQTDWDALYCVGFQTVLVRSLEYLATGKVTIDIPKEFPSEEQTVIEYPHKVKWKVKGKLSLNDITKVTDWKQKKSENEFVPLTPEEEAESFILPEGFVAECVASEPMVEEPVLAVWDSNGAMYVAEMRSYMQDEKGTGTKTLKNGRIKRLVDTNGDGIMDKATIFADNLNLPRMILPLDGRIAVVETDHTRVWSFKDTNNDGVADEKTVLMEGRPGSGTRSVEHQDSGLIWNLDNWIYTSYNNERYRLTNGTWKSETQPNHWAQWGLAHDDEGRIFYSNNNELMTKDQIPRVYWEHAIRSTGKKPRFYPNLGTPYDNSFSHALNLVNTGDRGGKSKAGLRKRITSGCGQSIYRGNGLPMELYGNYFACDPTIHMVKRGIFDHKNGKLEVSNPYGEEDFMVSSDFYFRPVNTMTGPDGCLYVVDMYRGIIQDSPWYDNNAQKFAKESNVVGVKRNGRIWRIRHRDVTPKALPLMQKESTASLIRHLASSNGWYRDTAQKTIILRTDREEVVPLLEGIVRYNIYQPKMRLHALWTLEGMGLVSLELLKEALQDRDESVLKAAIRISEKYIKDKNNEVISLLSPLVKSDKPEVVKQLILSLGYSDDEKALRIIEKSILNHLEHEGVYLAAMASLWGKNTPFVDSLKKGSAFKSVALLNRTEVASRWNNGIDSWDTKSLSLPKDWTARQRYLVSHGEKIFFETCRSCHGVNGEGKDLAGTSLKIAPPLVNSARVIGDPKILLSILLKGLHGPIEGKTYAGGMMPTLPSLGYSNTGHITQVANYIRFAWGHKLLPLEFSFVNEVKASIKERKSPWTLEELYK